LYDTLIEDLKQAGVAFAPGLTHRELSALERDYGVTFPAPLKAFYRKALPKSAGLYDWRDRSPENVKAIKERITHPAQYLAEHPREVDWCEAWGPEPDDPRKRASAIQAMVSRAPKLIPVYLHRYMADHPCDTPPVFSICGADIICYGKDLPAYLRAEFITHRCEVKYLSEITYIPFWSDLL